MRTRTKWEMRKQSRVQEVLRPFKKKVARLELQKQNISKKIITYKTKLIPTKKVILKKMKQQVTEIVMEEVPYDKPVTKVVEKTFTINKTEMRPITRKRWVTENVPRVIQKPQLKYVIEHIKRRAVRIVKELKSVEKEVPKTIPVPIGQVSLWESTEYTDKCSCYKADCECYGQEGCDCCYPECKCAPSMISPTETEIIIVQEEQDVPHSYIEEVAIEVPHLTYVNFTINEPRRIEKVETLEEPYIVQVN